METLLMCKFGTFPITSISFLNKGIVYIGSNNEIEALSKYFNSKAQGHFYYSVPKRLMWSKVNN